ncbi:rhamnogalacturonan acetylesterase [Alistipes shahii]|jgi:lysophospholipase L1-like esterase|uniref:rhamnogalacturonan acetylesterase n=1 Tax=Alistipes shahii TaxID=328814 RepID=UPI00266D41F1|nr:rhamnogalacturonan acetylesterase [Alistipes shahii]
MKTLKLLLCMLLLPAAEALAEGPVTLYTIGDSTMAPNTKCDEDPGDPGRGWAEPLQQFFDPAQLVVRNCAVSGRSTKSFIDEGRWQKVLDRIVPGDLLLIQFGHNDAKKSDPKRYTDPETTFKENLRRFVNETRGKGATPILATSIVRRQFGKDGTLRDSHGRYVPAAAEVAAELNVPLVDMNRLTGELVLKYGPEESKKLYLYVEPNVAERFPDGNADDTHLCIRGAEEFAALFAEACVAANNPLGRYVKPNPAR